MPSFQLTDSNHKSDQIVQVDHPDNLTKEHLLSFPAFKQWFNTLKANLALQHNESHPFHKTPYTLQKIEVQSVDWFGNRIGFIKLKAAIRATRNGKLSELPGIAFLRGGSVAVLMILRPTDSIDERYVVMTEQPRIPAGSLAFFEITAGMIDNADNFAGKAAEEIWEETGLKLQKEELIDMTKLALKNSKTSETTLESAMYPSPGGSDEFIAIFLWEQEMDRQEIEDLKDKLMGNQEYGENITLRVCDYEELWQHGARDAKTLAAWALYEGLNREGILRQHIVDSQRQRTQNEVRSTNKRV